MEGGLSDQFWLAEEQVERLRPRIPTMRCQVRPDDCSVLSGSIPGTRNDLRWRDAPAVQAPTGTFWTGFVRWSRLGSVFAGIPRDLARPGAEGDTIITNVETGPTTGPRTGGEGT